MSCYAQRKESVNTLFKWISYEVWPQVSNSVSNPLKEERKKPCPTLKGVVIIFKGSLFNPLPSFSVTQPWYLFFFPPPFWNCIVTLSLIWINETTVLIQLFEWDSPTSSNTLCFFMTDGYEPVEEALGSRQSLVLITAVRLPCRELNLEKVLQIASRENRQRHVSLKDSPTQQ